jgi:hypothetical protein
MAAADAQVVEARHERIERSTMATAGRPRVDPAEAAEA